MKILIVEDEMIISEDIAMTLEGRDYNITDQAVDYDEAIVSIQNNPPDLVLLDINLIGKKDGIDVAHKINELRRIPFIFTSSLGDALTISRAKETQPSAYLVKPFKDDQLFAAIEVAMAAFANSDEANTEEEKLPIFNDAIFIKEGHRYIKVDISDIRFIQKSENYLDIHTIDKRYTVRGSMGGFLDQLNASNIYRTHRSYAININHVKNVSPTAVSLGDQDIPLAKSYAEDLLSKLKIF